jgi:diguanylate cyclase (GGDEF)-like protein
VRRFSHRPGHLALVVAPAVLWTVACWFSVFGEDLRSRILVTAPMVAAYAFAIAAELWTGTSRRRWIARGTAIVIGLQGSIFAARFLLTLIAPDTFLAEGAGIAAPFHPAAIIESLVAAIALAFLLVSAANDEVGMQHRLAALVDPLTGVNNRRGFEAEVDALLTRTGRSGGSVVLLLIDLDHFKGINDRWGHPAGDLILQTLAAAVRAELGPGDVVGRLGGDEFGVVLAERRIDQALVVAEQIRRGVAAMTVSTQGSEIGFTISIGAAGSAGTGRSFNDLFHEADVALYRAKANGRNRVEFVPLREVPQTDLSGGKEKMQRVA